MYGDALRQAIDTINEYVEQGNVVYLFSENVSGEYIKLEGAHRVNFTLISEIECEE